ncbi:hypothetical protein ARMGADRAFT_1086937, partial [Armillaria gallica]
MAEPPVVKDAAALKHDALSAYDAAAALLQHKVDFPPDQDSSSQNVDEWISDVYLQWTVCSNFWKPAGIKKTVWNDAEYALLACLPLVDMSLIDDSRERFNALVHRAHKYSIPNLRPIPLDTPSPSPEPALRVRTPAPPRTMTPPPVPKPTTPPPQKEKTPVPRKQQSTAPVTPQRSVPQRTPDLAGSVPRLDLLVAKSAANASSSGVRAAGLAPINIVKPPLPKFTAFSTAQKTGHPTASQRKVTPESPKSSDAFQKDWTSPLHSKPAQQLQIGSSVNATRSEMPARASSRAFAVDAAARPNVILGPDPNLDFLQEGNVLVPSTDREPLFLPGTDDEEEQAPEDLVEAGHVNEEVVGTDSEDDGPGHNSPSPIQHEPMNVDGADPQGEDEGSSPPPTNKAHRLHHEPRISFVFNDTTGDFADSYPTIFLPRPAVPPAPSQDLRCSARSHTSPVDPDTAYLKTLLGPQSDAKKKKRNSKRKDKAAETAIPRKWARDDDDGAPIVEKPATKKLKSTVVKDKGVYLFGVS